MVDVAKHIEYWRKGAEEDWPVGQELVARQRTRHGLFFVHLALEKALKAHVCKATADAAPRLTPRLHNLVRLAEIARLNLSPEQLDALAVLNSFSLAGRYPETATAPLSRADADVYVGRAEQVFQWLIGRL
jgi:HEPN domain-containing protein